MAINDQNQQLEKEFVLRTHSTLDKRKVVARGPERAGTRNQALISFIRFTIIRSRRTVRWSEE